MKFSNVAILTAATATTTAAFVMPSATRAMAARSSSSEALPRNLFNQLFSSATETTGKYPIMAEEAVMSQKAHGTSEKPVMKNLRWNCDYDTADRICNFNRHYAGTSVKENSRYAI